jgi:zinc finger MIZ domain-containing protein
MIRSVLGFVYFFHSLIVNDLQMPHTPHTPGAVASTPGQANTPGGGNSGPPSVPPASDTNLTGGGPSSSGGNNSLQPLADSEIPSDLNFDPAAVIDGEGAGQEALNVS